MKIVEYAIYSDRSDPWLVDKVNEAIKGGWQPLGSPFIGDSLRYQAMVRYEAEITTKERQEAFESYYNAYIRNNHSSKADNILE